MSPYCSIRKKATKFVLQIVPPEEPEPTALLIERLNAIPDPRVQGRVLHLMGDILFSALCAIVSGAQDFTSIAAFAEGQLTWLRTYVPLVNGAPSHDVFRNVFMMIKPASLIELLTEFVGELAGKHISIDGKVLRGAKNSETGRSQVHLLRAWVAEVGLSIQQVRCDDKSNELSTLPSLLAKINLKGAIVSIDAMAGHASVAQLINKGGGDYILALKANEPEILETVAMEFKKRSGQCELLPGGVPLTSELHPPCLLKGEAKWATSCDVFTRTERNRGRYEHREVIAISVGDWFKKAFLWYGLKSAFCVIRTTMRHRQKGGEPTREVHYYLSSLPPEALWGYELIRAHWSVEAHHHLLDVVFDEDHSQIRDEQAAQVFSLFREFSARIIKETPGSTSVKSSRFKAATNPTFRSRVIDTALANFGA